MSEKYYSLTQLKSIMRTEGNQWTGPYEIICPDDLKKLKPADVRPVKRGEWIGAYDDLKCSECGKNWDELRTADGDDWGYWEYKPPYCPNCGADMTGGDAQ